MQAYKITIAYDGSDFFGWQVQPDQPTVMSKLCDVYHKTFGHKIHMIGASRTDTGVHALGQIALFRTHIIVGEEKMRDAWNNALPQSIRIRSLEKAPENFHPCKNVRQKTYWYILFLKPPLPLVARYGWYYPFMKRVCLDKFYQALKLYEGTHNFTSFCRIEDAQKNPVRTIDSIEVKKWGHMNTLLVSIKGQSFLRFQIRRMVGYALDVAQRPDLSVNYIQQLLDNPHDQQTLIKADGSGLCLRKVTYHD
ncbi:MAG: tRNA pseudouridine(38-40) synthase TruA [Epsilonproteobacteria bacterium]|nr:tRNA pseudouridine(38-40) synthase TruA [Campylobacterota bacterium]